MSLMTAMNTSISGMRVTQLGIDSVAQNIANADSIGYTRRRLYSVERIAGETGVGVRSAELRRTLDTILQRQVRLESSAASYTDATYRFQRSIDQLFGPPGGASSLDTIVNRFTDSLRQLAADPGGYASRANVLDAAGVLASTLNNLTEDVQALRTDAEAAIASGAQKVNNLLSDLTRVNAQLMGSSDTNNPVLLDQRDQIINDIAKLVDVRVTETQEGGISVYTTGGLQLFDGRQAVRLDFDQRTNLSPNSVYNPDPLVSGVGVLRAVNGLGGSVDVIASNLFRSGEISAYLKLRDDTLVEAQRQLDELAAGLSLALSDRQVTGTAATVGPATGFDVDLTGLQPGNIVTLDAVLTPSGQRQRFSFVRVDDPTQLPLPNNATADSTDIVFGIDFSGGLGSVAAQIQAALGGGYTVSNPAGNTLRIVDDGAGNTTNVTGLQAGITVTGLTSGAPELPFFVDGGAGGTPYTGSFDGGTKLTGFAGRIAVNAALNADPSRLVVYNLAPQTLSGDPARPTRLLDALTNTTRAFSVETGVGGAGASFNGNILSYARRVVETQGANTEAAARLDEGQKTVLASLESRYAETAGVNVDEEMSRLVQLQTAYAANARVITAAKEMMDLLLRL